jgi:hypothetical protein
MSVEPPADADMAPDAGDVTPRKPSHLRQDLAHVLDVTPSEADDWIDEHGAVAATERVRAFWIGQGYYRSESDAR